MAGGTHVDDLTSILASGVAESDLVYVGAVGDPDPDRKMTVAELRTLLYRYIASGAPARITLGRSPANAAETAQLDFLELDSGSEDAEFGGATGSYGMRVEYDGADNVMRWKGAVLSSEQTLMELDRNGTPANLTLSNGNLRLGTAGRGIDFSGVGTAAEILDDYEEGTWTPVPETEYGFTPGASATYEGWYTKVGDLVVCRAEIDYDTSVNVAVGDRAILSGLPFTPAPSMGQIGAVGTCWLYGSIGSGINAIGNAWAQDGSLWGFLIGSIPGSAPLWTYKLGITFAYRV